MTWMLRLYPRAWRRRYEAEIAEVIAAQPSSLRLAVDLLGGAVDAHMNPQSHGGTDMVHRLKRCGAAADMTPVQGGVAAVLTLLTGVVVAGLLMLGQGQVSRAMVLTVFPALLVLPAQWFYLRGHSWPARIVLMGGPIVICLLIGLIAGLVVSD